MKKAPEQTALEGIERTLDYFRSLGMPTNLRELGIGEVTDAQIEEMADRCMHYGKRTIGSLKVLKNCKVEADMAGTEAPASIQFMRQGYFCADSKDSAPGHLVFNRSVSLKDSFKK